MKDVAQRGVIRAVINPSHADSSYQCANKAIQSLYFLYFAFEVVKENSIAIS